jgi:capsular exopolysaccharide synthesis family protein
MTDNPLARYLVPLRRWWPIIMGALALGIVAAWVTLPETPDPAEQEVVVDPDVSYRATHLLIRNRDTPATANLDLVTVMARQGAIPAAVEAKLGDEIAPGSVESVLLEPDPLLQTLAVTAVQPTAEQTVLLAETYAEEIVDYFDARALEAESDQVDAVTNRLTEIGRRVREIEVQLEEELDEGTVEYDLAQAEYDSLSQQYGILQAEQLNLTTQSVTTQSTFETLQEPVPVSTVTPNETVFQVPQDSRARFILVAMAALVSGIALVFAVDWVDTRVRTRDDAEAAFGLPVIAEFPRRTKTELRKHPIPVHTDPGSITAETFRALRLVVLRSPRWRLDRAKPTAGGEGPVGSASPVTGTADPRVLLVSSARDGEGKSTIAANLAVSIAETGKSVLLIDSDFRRPSVGAFIGVPDGPGLRELSELNGQELAKAIVFTELPNLAMLRSGSAGIAPSWFLSEAGWVIDQARELADVVVIDSGPLLATNEAATLVPNVDTLLLVTKSGRISQAQARRTTEQLSRLGATVSGVVVLGAAGRRQYGYYEPIRNAAALGEKLRP